MKRTRDTVLCRFTKDYSLFAPYELNRKLRPNPVLEASMKKYGFLCSRPVACFRRADGKLEIFDGHHRFMIAKALGIGIWYIIERVPVDLYYINEGDGRWTGTDWLGARVRAGDKDCKVVVDYMDQHPGVKMGSAAALVAGNTSLSSGVVKEIVKGVFVKGKSQSHADRVGKLIDLCTAKGLPFATSSAFTNALSQAVKIPEMDFDHFLHVIDMRAHLIMKRGTLDEYLKELESVYNHGAKTKRLWLSARAQEESRKMQRSILNKPKDPTPAE